METGIKVGDCMKTNLVTVSESASVMQAAGVMKEKDVNSLLVVDAMGEKSGLVTSGDLVRRSLATGKVDATVGAIASKPYVTISPDADISEAAGLMGKKGVKRLVVKKGNDVVGIISQVDIIRITPSLYELIAHAHNGEN